MKHENNAYNTQRTYVAISLKNLRHNIELIRAKVPAQKELLAVVKADAYGHGVDIVAPFLQTLGIKWYAVATIDEALNLRELGIKGEILVLSQVAALAVPLAIENNIILALGSLESAEQYAAMIPQGQKLRVHLKIDTGMTRLGFRTDETALDSSIAAATEIIKNNKFSVEGIFSHLAFGSANYDYTDMQKRRYKAFIGALEKTVGKHFIHHIQASSSMTMPNFDGDLVRMGIVMYGGFAASPHGEWNDVKPVMSYISKISAVRECEIGEGISYDATYRAKRHTKLAIVPCGYADGVPVALSSKGVLLVHGREVPIVGRVCMDRFMVDVTDLPDDVKIGDEALFYGETAQGYLPAKKQAELASTIDYELFCRVMPRVPRVIID